MIALKSAALLLLVGVASAQPERWIVTTGSGEVLLSPSEAELEGNSLIVRHADDSHEIALEGIQSLFVLDTLSFWSAAAEGALWGAALGGATGLVTGITWAATGSESVRETVGFLTLPALVLGAVTGTLGGIIGGISSVIDAGETVDMKGLSIEDKRIFFRELLDRRVLEMRSPVRP